MTTTPDESAHCPECGKALEAGQALSLSAMAVGAAYLCTACRMLYAHDLQPLARMVG